MKPGVKILTGWVVHSVGSPASILADLFICLHIRSRSHLLHDVLRKRRALGDLARQTNALHQDLGIVIICILKVAEVEKRLLGRVVGR